MQQSNMGQQNEKQNTAEVLSQSHTTYFNIVKGHKEWVNSMSSLLCQFFHRLQRHPLAVLIVALLVTLFSLFILQQTSLSPSFSALFDKQSEEKEEASNLLFRSTAHLTLVVQGEDPAQNRAYIADFIETYVKWFF